jgi:hypothetical protein
MPPFRTIKAKEIISDIESGMSKSELMKKYRLSARGLRSAFRQLVAADAISYLDPWEDTSVHCDESGIKSLRRFTRYYLDFELTVFDEARPKVHGIVRDITERGLGLTGIEAQINETKTLVIEGDEFTAVGPIRLKAKCRWIKRVEVSGARFSGFEITWVSSGDSSELKKLIQLATVRD